MRYVNDLRLMIYLTIYFEKSRFYDDTFKGNEITFVSVDMIYHIQQYTIRYSRLMQQLGKCENKIFKCVYRQKKKMSDGKMRE